MHSCPSLGSGWPALLPQELLPQETEPTLACILVSSAGVPRLLLHPFLSRRSPIPSSHLLVTLFTQCSFQGHGRITGSLSRLCL